MIDGSSNSHDTSDNNSYQFGMRILGNVTISPHARNYLRTRYTMRASTVS